MAQYQPTIEFTEEELKIKIKDVFPSYDSLRNFAHKIPGGLGPSVTPTKIETKEREDGTVVVENYPVEVNFNEQSERNVDILNHLKNMWSNNEEDKTIGDFLNLLDDMKETPDTFKNSEYDKVLKLIKNKINPSQQARQGGRRRRKSRKKRRKSRRKSNRRKRTKRRKRRRRTRRRR